MADNGLSDQFRNGGSSDGGKSTSGKSTGGSQANFKQTLESLTTAINNLNTKLTDGSSTSSNLDGIRNSHRGQQFYRANDSTGAIGAAAYNRGRGGQTADPTKAFLDGLTQQLLKSLGRGDVEKQMTKSLQEVAKRLGTTVEDVPNALGAQIGKAFSDTSWGKKLSQRVDKNAENYFMGISKSAITKWGNSKISGKHGENIANALTYSSKGSSGAENAVKSDGSGVDSLVDKGVSKAVKGVAESLGMGEVIDLLGPIMEGVNLMGTAMTPFQAIAPLVESIFGAIGTLSKIFNKDTAMDEQRVKNAQERYRQDIETIVKTPFDILEDAANKVMDAWDGAIRVINQTQGYNKASLQALMSDYAQRLRAEGLTNVVSGADITSNLQSVLQAGLLGKVAEEFAYQATILKAAIPTQDFFSYASTYASIAANAMQAGKSQADALALANDELKQFASNVLYSNRVLSGGFTTGLQNASGLFDLAARIVNSAHNGNVSNVSGVLTAVAGVVGAVAPDLAGGLTSVLETLTLGGNSGTATALRSLAGINASNTEFLQAFVKNPQGIIANIFSGLSQYQTMSEGNYMEVAEGLAGVFGIDKSALARVDFASLAQAVRDMSVNNKSLDENMSLLQSGQSTLTSDQQRYQQINEFMINEGLSLVLDNEAGRAIQQHMWQEQLANQMMEATYGVDLHGTALDLLQSVRSTLKNVVSLLVPWAGTVKSAVNLSTTLAQTADKGTSIRQILKAGAVGTNYDKELYTLTTRGVQNLGLIGDLQSLWGIKSGLHTAANVASAIDSAIGLNDFSKWKSVFITNGTPSTKSSMYRWGNIPKSLRSALAVRKANIIPISSGNAEDMAAVRLQNNVDAFLASMSSAVQSNMTYQEWLNTSSKYGLDHSTLAESLSKVGQTMANVEEAFSDSQTERDRVKAQERQEKEVKFWEKSALNEDSYLKTMTEEMVAIHTDLLKWANSWDNINNRYSTYYGVGSRDSVFSGSGGVVSGLDKAEQLLAAVKSNEAEIQAGLPAALAKVLADNLSSLVDLKDPTAQTNVLLAQLINVVVSILQAVNSPGKMDIPSSLSAMALGLLSPNE